MRSLYNNLGVAIVVLLLAVVVGQVAVHDVRSSRAGEPAVVAWDTFHLGDELTVTTEPADFAAVVAQETGKLVAVTDQYLVLESEGDKVWIARAEVVSVTKTARDD